MVLTAALRRTARIKTVFVNQRTSLWQSRNSTSFFLKSITKRLMTENGRSVLPKGNDLSSGPAHTKHLLSHSEDMKERGDSSGGCSASRY
jgi:hypothetical protein